MLAGVVDPPQDVSENLVRAAGAEVRSASLLDLFHVRKFDMTHESANGADIVFSWTRGMCQRQHVFGGHFAASPRPDLILVCLHRFCRLPDIPYDAMACSLRLCDPNSCGCRRSSKQETLEYLFSGPLGKDWTRLDFREEFKNVFDKLSGRDVLIPSDTNCSRGMGRGRGRYWK